jgi:hypothetical protein
MRCCRRMVVIAFMLLRCERYAWLEVCLFVLAWCGLAKRIRSRWNSHARATSYPSYPFSSSCVLSRLVFTFILPHIQSHLDLSYGQFQQRLHAAEEQTR